MVAPARFADPDRARAVHGDALVARIVEASFLTDDPADRLVADFRVLPGGAGWRMLDAALAGDPPADAPASLADLLAPVFDTPSWLDLARVRAGQVAWWRVGGMPQLLVLTAGSLAFGYGSANLARPLAATGRLEQMAPRRLSETARWVLGATRPGALEPGAPGVAQTIRLRLVHALVRRHLRESGWDVAELGEPINVADTIATGMAGFFVVPARALRDLGVRWSSDELEAITHLWRWICTLMGVPGEHLPGDYAETVAWTDAAIALDPGPIPESAALLDALLYRGLRFDRVLPGPAAAVARVATGQALGAFARRWMDADRADVLGAPDTPLKHLAVALRPLAFAREAARRTGVLGSDETIVAREFAVMQRTMALVGAAPVALAPEHVEREPVLRRAA